MRNTISIYGQSPLWNWMAGDFDDFFDRAPGAIPEPATAALIPYEMEETEAGYLMTIDLPGVRREDLKIEVVEDTLTVSGERKSHAGQGRKIFGRFPIPASADAEKIEASLENGVLEIALPKMDAAKPRSIPIVSGATGVFSKLIGAKKDKSFQAS